MFTSWLLTQYLLIMFLWIWAIVIYFVYDAFAGLNYLEYNTVFVFEKFHLLGIRSLKIFSLPVESLCHTPGLVRRSLSVVCHLCPP